jgi:hypothetical protein
VFPRRTRSLVGVRQGPVSLNRRAAYAAPRHCTSSVEPANGHVLTLDAPPTMKRAAAEFATESYWKDEGWDFRWPWMDGWRRTWASKAQPHRRRAATDASHGGMAPGWRRLGQMRPQARHLKGHPRRPPGLLASRPREFHQFRRRSDNGKPPCREPCAKDVPAKELSFLGNKEATQE